MGVIQRPEEVQYSLFGREPYSSSDVSFVYVNQRGNYRLVENGEQLPRAELKSQRYHLRYTVQHKSIKVFIQTSFPSEDIGDDFEIDLTAKIKVADPVELIKNGLDDIDEYVRDYLKQQIHNLTKRYSIDEWTELQQVFPSQLNLSDLEEAGLAVTLTGSVDLNEELKARKRKQRQTLDDIDFNNVVKKKEAAELLEIFAGTPVEVMLPLYDNVSDLRKAILTEIKDKKESLKAIDLKFANGDIDEVQYKRAKVLLGDSLLVGQVGNPQVAKLESKSSKKKNRFKKEAPVLTKTDDEEWD